MRGHSWGTEESRSLHVHSPGKKCRDRFPVYLLFGMGLVKTEQKLPRWWEYKNSESFCWLRCAAPTTNEFVRVSNLFTSLSRLHRRRGAFFHSVIGVRLAASKVKSRMMSAPAGGWPFSRQLSVWVRFKHEPSTTIQGYSHAQGLRPRMEARPITNLPRHLLDLVIRIQTRR